MIDNYSDINKELDDKIDSLIKDLYDKHNLVKDSTDISENEKTFRYILKKYGIKLIMENYIIPFVYGHFASNNKSNAQEEYEFFNETRLKHIIALFKFDFFLKGIIRNIIEEFEVYLRGQLYNFLTAQKNLEFFRTKIFVYSNNGEKDFFSKLFGKEFESNKSYNKYFFDRYKSRYVTNWDKINDFIELDLQNLISSFTLEGLCLFISSIKNLWIINNLFSNVSKNTMLKFYKMFYPIINNLRNRVAHNTPIFKFKAIDDNDKQKEDKFDLFKEIMSSPLHSDNVRLMQIIKLLFSILKEDVIFSKNKYERKITEKLKTLWDSLENNKDAIKYLKDKLGIDNE